MTTRAASSASSPNCGRTRNAGAAVVTVGSLFAGIGGFDLGFERAGYLSVWRCEIEPFCQRVLTRRFQTTPIYDDVRLMGRACAAPDVLVGGFPCQDVSVAGQRKGLKGERSGLFFEFDRLIGEFSPRWVVIENVPGLLSNAGGADFAAVLAAVVQRGYGVVWRILDSKYFGVAQRRRRVFLVLRAGTARSRPTQILFESASGAGSLEAGAEAGSDVAVTLRGRSARRGVHEPGRGGEDDSNLIAIGVHANQRGELRTSPLSGSLNGSQSGKQYEGVAFTLRANERNTSQGPGNYVTAFNPQSGGDPRFGVGELPTALSAHQITGVAVPEREHALVQSMHKGHDDDTDTLIPTLTGNLGHHGYGSDRGDGSQLVANTLLAPNGGQRTDDLNQTFTPTIYGVRRLTPLECERVQGFPDGWTCLCGEGYRGSDSCTCPDTPRYKALGNAITVPVAQWIAERIQEAEKLSHE